jgi:MFS family permease
MYLCLGVFEVSSGKGLGYIYDKYGKNISSIRIFIGKKCTLVILLCFMLLAGIFTYLGYYFNNFYLFFPAVAGYGVGDCGSHTLVGALLTEKYGKAFEPHAAYRVVFGTAMGVTVFAGIWMKDEDPIWTISIYSGILIIASITSYKAFDSFNKDK